jgi:hypothetical protein
MSEKRLLQASVLLVRSLKIINKPEMAEIGAVSDLRSYLVGQETVRQNDLAFQTKRADNFISRLFEISWSTNCTTIYISNPFGVNLGGQLILPINEQVCNLECSCTAD